VHAHVVVQEHHVAGLHFHPLQGRHHRGVKGRELLQ
jgi:hypothetical protein